MDVTADDLLKPLGVAQSARRFALPRLPVTRILIGGLTLFAVGIGGFIAVVEDPLGGEPHAIVPIEPAPVAFIREAAPVGPVAGGGPQTSAAAIETASGVSVIRPNGMNAPESIVIRVPDPEVARLAPAPDLRLAERTRYGLLPRIGADGARPSGVYARPPGGLAGGASPAARVALVVTGLGISQNATAGAIAALPPAVTFAFAPYGADLDKTVGRAREEGHEVMLQVPMEPFDYPDNDPGPHTLRTQARGHDNLDKLHWAMGRFTGYTGLVNFMGAKLTADEAALTPVLREIAGRGLTFLDDGSSSRSLVKSVGPANRVPVARADVVLDGVARTDLIDAELARLEETARKKGFAIGTASAMPLTVERIARWAKALEGRGVLLVPASYAFASENRP